MMNDNVVASGCDKDASSGSGAGVLFWLVFIIAAVTSMATGCWPSQPRVVTDMNLIYRIARRFRAACRTNEQQASTVLMLSLMMGLALLQRKDAADIPLSVWVACIGFWPLIAFLANLHSPIPEPRNRPEEAEKEHDHD